MNTRRTTLIVALVLALLAGWLLLRYLSNLQNQTNANTRPVAVIVASQEIPARVEITPAMLATVQRPANAIDPNVLQTQDAKSVIGSLSLITIPAGASITQAMVGRPSDVGLTVRLQPGMRAVSVMIDKVKGISGLVQPGDRVDVIAEPARSGAAPPPAATILRGIRVLSIGENLEETSATPSPQEQQATTVTLEVTPRQADLLVMADLNTTLRLALRSPKEPVNSLPTETMHFDQGIAPGAPNGAAPSGDALTQALVVRALGNVGGPQAPGSTAIGPPKGSAQYDASGVQIIDGDHYSGGSQPGGDQ